jgi:hypothetical protein
MAITNLAYTDTFKTWFDTTNTIINSVNGITVYNILAGDGIGITSANNIFTISHGSSVATGVTFAGSVKFNGSVSFASSPSISSTTINVTPVISGITAGKIVRMTSSGLTLAKADSATNAEVLGMVVNTDGTSHVVAINGQINNTLFANTIANALGVVGGTLTAGQAYFLDPIVAGGITINEPQTYGYVTKPVLLGISGNAGSLLPYRGIQIEGISAGITAELDNKIIIEVDYNTTSLFVSGPVKIGDPVLYYDDTQTASDEVYGLFSSPNFIKLNGKLNGSVYDILVVPNMNNIGDASLNLIGGKNFLGLVSKIITEDTIGKKTILEVVLPGGSFTANIADLSDSFYAVALTKTGHLGRNEIDTLQYDQNNTFVEFIKTDSNTAKLILVGNKFGSTSTSGGTPPSSTHIAGTTYSYEYDNLIPNGTFSVWQRGITGITAGSVDKFTTAFADRWFIVKSGLTGIDGLTLSATRQEFTSNQTLVPGSPEYYIDINAQYSGISGINDRIKLENIQSQARLLQNQQATISFWAKATNTGVTLDLYYNRYKDSYSTAGEVKNTIDSRTLLSTSSEGVTLSTNWKEYAYAFNCAVAGFTLAPTETGWFATGFEFPSSTETISIAQVQLELGESPSAPIYVSKDEELKRCQPYYYKTYPVDVPPGTVLGTDAYKFNVGVRGASPSNTHYIKYPVKMVKANPSFSFYSPVTGQLNDGYNYTASTDMRYTQGTPASFPWTGTVLSRTAVSSGNITSTTVTDSETSIAINNGAIYFDDIHIHYVIDADLDVNI